MSLIDGAALLMVGGAFGFVLGVLFVASTRRYSRPL